LETVRVPVLIVGASTGGVAASLACARNGVRCLVTEPTAWVGGQLTTQAVPPDENPWVDANGPHAPAVFVGCTASYADLRRRVRAWYRSNRPLIPEDRDNPKMNPGRGWVSRLCAEPRVFESCLRQMLAAPPFGGSIQVRTNTDLFLVEHHADRITRVIFTARDTGERFAVEADLVLDATDLGDVLDLGQIESLIGAESQHVFNELHARTDLRAGISHDDRDQQAFSWCFAMEHRPGEDHTIARPSDYVFWKSFVPDMAPPWTGPLFSWTVPTHTGREGRHLPMVPWPDEPEQGQWELWRYRRIVDRAAYAEAHAAQHPDTCLVNWVQMDHWLHPLLGIPHADRAQAYAAAREQSRCLFYWMQTDAPRHDGGTGYPGLKLRGDELGTDDGFAMAAYIREPRRLHARTMLTEAHVGTEQRQREGRPNQDATKWGSGEVFSDSIAIGHYPIDLHPSCAGRNNVYVPACPFQIPLASLVPIRVRNLLSAGKALGVSHVVNGCTRLHPVEWAIGEAAGLTAAWCQNHKTEPHAVCDVHTQVESIRAAAVDQGMPVRWPWDL
jgi:hypothetical protein